MVKGKDIHFLAQDGQDERRRFKRYPFRNAVLFQIKQENRPPYLEESGLKWAYDTGRPWGSAAFDLSEGGARILVNDFLPLGSELICEVSFPNQMYMECAGKVAWVEKERFNDRYYLGIEFEKGMKMKKKSISDFIKEGDE